MRSSTAQGTFKITIGKNGCLFIFYNALRIGKPALLEIMDIAPPEHIIESIKKTASEVQKVKAIDKCLVRKMGFEYYVDIHIVVDGELTVREGHDIAHRVKERLLNSQFRIQDVLVHVEPFNPNYSEKKSLR